MFAKQPSSTVTVRQMSVMFRKCVSINMGEAESSTSAGLLLTVEGLDIYIHCTGTAAYGKTRKAAVYSGKWRLDQH